MSDGKLNKKYDFEGKVVLVTGSSSGIGEASAIQFAQYGAKVTIHGRNQEALGRVAQKIQQISGREPLQVVGDLLEESTVTNLIEKTIEKFGRLDVLVNNAGMGSRGNVFSPDLMQEFDKIMTVNLRAPVQLIHLAAPHLVKTKGNIVNISSVIGIKPYILVYSTSKAALDMVTKTAAQDLAPKGVRVNSVNPGVTLTNFPRSFADANFFRDRKEMIKKQTPLNRLAEPEDIANLISFVASDDAKNITGAIYANDGGALLGAKPELVDLATKNNQ